MEFYSDTRIHIEGLTEIDPLALNLPPEAGKINFSTCNAAIVASRVLIPRIDDYVTWGMHRFPYPPFYTRQFEKDFFRRNINDLEFAFCFRPTNLDGFSSVKNPDIIVKGVSPDPSKDLLVRIRIGIIVPINFQDLMQNFVSLAIEA